MDKWPDREGEMGAASEAAAPGWYYAQGDPIGTTRYWDGSQWTGEPVVQPQAAAQPHGVAQGFPPAPAVYDPAAGQYGSAVIELSPLEYWVRGWKSWNQFAGRARRAEYFWFSLFNGLVSFLLQTLSAVEGIRTLFVILYLIFALVSLVPAIAVGIRRMHDSNHSGWWIICPFVNIIFTFLDSDRNPNEYGLSPKYEAAYNPANSFPTPSATPF